MRTENLRTECKKGVSLERNTFKAFYEDIQRGSDIPTREGVSDVDRLISPLIAGTKAFLLSLEKMDSLFCLVKLQTGHMREVRRVIGGKGG